MAAGPFSTQPLHSSSFFLYLLPVLPVGAQRPETFIGYFTTACVAISLAIFSYILLPRMVSLGCPGAEGCGNVGPLHITAQESWSISILPMAPTSLHLLGQGKLSPVLREFSGISLTSDTPISLGYCGNEPLGERESISIGLTWKELFAHVAYALVASICCYPHSPCQPSILTHE